MVEGGTSLLFIIIHLSLILFLWRNLNNIPQLTRTSSNLSYENGKYRGQGLSAGVQTLCMKQVITTLGHTKGWETAYALFFAALVLKVCTAKLTL